jgi:hypothetical protein
MVAGPTLTYFPLPGRGEIARLAFTVGKINFVVRIFFSCLAHAAVPASAKHWCTDQYRSQDRHMLCLGLEYAALVT